MLGSHSRSTSIGSNNNSSNNNNSIDGNSGSDNSDLREANPKSMSARLSAGMIPYFIPPQPQSTVGQRSSFENTNGDSSMDPTLMTPPMSPTEQSFGFGASSTIEGRFAASSPMSQAYAFSQNEQRSPWTDMGSSSVQGSISSPASSGSSSAAGSTAGLSPRPLSFHWDRYETFEEEEDEDQDDQYSQDEAEADVHEDRSSMSGNTPYYRQFEGHHSMVRRRSSFASGKYEDAYDSIRHGIGLNVSDMSEELAKARSKMTRASRAMKNMEQELEAMQLSIDESKASSASTRTAIEENFWRLECLALTIEKDRQESNKRLQSVGRDCNEAIEAVTNWEVRIDWLGRRVDNTSEYVSELVLSEQECMSFIKMIIQQNQRYAMPAISRATERNIKLMAPPRLKEISNAAHRQDIPLQMQQSRQQPQPQAQLSPHPPPQPPLQPPPSVRHIPISWLLDPIMPPKPPEISSSQDKAQEQVQDDSTKTTKATIEPPAELWRDFSRLTTAFETGQARTPFSPFQRTRSRSTGQGATSGLGINSSSSSGGHGASIFKANMSRRPQVENLSPMPKILPATVAPTKLPVVKRRSQNMSHLPVHSWLQLQFNKTMTTPGTLAQPGSKKTTNVLGLKPITIFQTTV